MDSFVESLVESKTHSLLEEVNKAARPSQQLDRVKGKITVGVDITATETDLDK